MLYYFIPSKNRCKDTTFSEKSRLIPASSLISSVFLRCFFGISSVNDRRNTEETPKND